jgi:dTDP-4-dehydrorhamnose 3,5-epimerase
MIIDKTSIPGLLIIKPNIYEDNRGYFIESYKHSDFVSNGLRTDFLQQNQSESSVGVLRGLHYQLKYGQGKLVWVVKGKVMDIAVDIRKDSPTFGQYESIILDDESHKRLYIPEGFAHGFYVLSEKAIFQYMCTEIYHPEDEYGVLWNDPDICIKWPDGDKLVSDNDKQLPSLKEINPKNLPTFK